MNRDGIEAFVLGLYNARVTGDMDVLAGIFAGDATFQIAGSPGHSLLATVAEGHEGVMALLQTIVDTLELENLTILDLLVEDNKVAVRWRATVHQVTSGEIHTSELADFIEIRNGKVVSFIEFLDTALAG
jgi:ketosteroid isomerase-like protein